MPARHGEEISRLRQRLSLLKYKVLSYARFTEADNTASFALVSFQFSGRGPR